MEEVAWSLDGQPTMYFGNLLERIEAFSINS